MKIVKLLQNNQQVAPQVIAESVLVKRDSVITLDKVLDKKVEIVTTSDSSGLVITRSGTTVDISHKNTITVNNTPEAKLIQYDNTGHIIATADTKKHSIIVNTVEYNQYDGNTDTTTSFGDDFTIDSTNNIALTWAEK